MNIKIKHTEEENCISQNIAYIRAILIKKHIENLNATTDEKQNIFRETLKFLRST